MTTAPPLSSWPFSRVTPVMETVAPETISKICDPGAGGVQRRFPFWSMNAGLRPVVSVDRKTARARAPDCQVLVDRHSAAGKDDRCGVWEIEIDRTAILRVGDRIAQGTAPAVVRVGHGVRGRLEFKSANVTSASLRPRDATLIG